MNKAIAYLALAASLLATEPLHAARAAKHKAAVKAEVAGKQVFNRWCFYCHAVGERYPGTASLAVKYGDTLPAALEDRTDLTPEMIGYFVRHGVATMPPFRKTEITDTELAQLSAYLTRIRSK